MENGAASAVRQTNRVIRTLSPFDISLISNYNIAMQTRDIVSLISKIREKVNRFIVSEMAENGIDGIGTSHGDIIYALFKTPRMTMADISQRINKDKSTVTALVEKLVQLGYVTKERSQEDARVVHVALTPKGSELEHSFESISHKMLDVFYINISDQEKEDLLKVLSKIYNNF
ncbi:MULTISPECIES: MarR family winged helix-turn-helix transcriptional regulator [Paenibacillus]|uniref:MarR family winged helix-turn-helix transcriptional regulator n=1 Tax=Paenibacillus TaxID=44249 RepID=UPI002041E8F5|nr:MULTISPECIES: MarR family winged helix-turn-helix transcriptional regulator [Paenibacillus]